MPLTEDEIDDLLYLARINDTTDLSSLLTSLSQTHSLPPQTILEAAQDPETGNGVLHYAAANGHIDILDFILSLYPSPSSSSSQPTSTSTSNPSSSITGTPRIPLLHPNDQGNTPLHYASLNGHLAFVKRLVALGADPAARNAAGHDPVYEAEMGGRDEVVGWLLAEGGASLEGGVGGEEGGAEIGEDIDVGVSEVDGEEKIVEGVRRELERAGVVEREGG
ncbi:ankyrin [Patellaria atrata CBS 101060]|uniref:Ankyrin n=1 Tax=Patellaria atrata CBS 101060 TaxID=1346257 RepID=A0A9P4VV63_9PEZI|nr:ankyrin [Patellaria atrata CBS 101060]